MRSEVGTFMSGMGLLIAGSAHAGGPVAFDVDARQSTVLLQTSNETFWPGFLIGDFDARTNPDGTLTRPGLFGGSGNLPVSIELTPQVEALIDGAPEGVLTVDADPRGGVIAIDGLLLDLLGAGSGSADLTVVFLFETFRSFNPDSLFPGGVPVPVPLGDVPILSATMVQSAPAIGTLIEAEGPAGLYDAVIVIPIALSFEIDLFGDPFLIGPVPGALALTGTYAIDGSSATLTLGADFSESIVDEGPFDVGFEAIPFGLPTVLPAGDVANVLLSGNLERIDSTQTIDIQITATGALSGGLFGDLNGDGVVDLSDLLVLLAAWGACGDPCPADLNGDGSVDLSDLLLLLAAWTG